MATRAKKTAKSKKQAAKKAAKKAVKKAAKKGEAPEKDGDPVTISVAKDAKIVKGMFNKDTKKVEAGDKIEGGLTSETFTKIGEKGVAARITTDADNKTVTQIMVTHDVPVAREASDLVFMLEGGKVACSGAPGEVLTALAG